MTEPNVYGGLEVDDDDRELEQEFEVRKRKIRAAPIVAQHLKTLEQAGADKEKILTWLAVVTSEDHENLADLFGKRQRHFSSLAKRLERIADETQASLSNLGFSAELFEALIFPERSRGFRGEAELEKRSNEAVRQVKPILDLLRAEGTRFAKMRRECSKIKRGKFLRQLLRYVKQSTGRNYDKMMADLLQSAHDSLGADIRFNEVWLSKFRQRIEPTMIRKHKKRAPKVGIAE
ncbi:MAG: hypothetical protein ABSB50_13565 [Terracidiphilus sp.]|jgi:hypothetical protein